MLLAFAYSVHFIYLGGNMTVIGRILSIIGAITVMLIILLVAWGLISRWYRGRVPSNTVLELDLRDGVTEIQPTAGAASFIGPKKPTIQQIVDAFERAGDDKRVTGVIARIGATSMSVAHIQEIRQAVNRFRQTGKKTIIFAETFGEFGQGTGVYYLATAFDSIYLQPSGTVGFSGLIMRSPFVRSALEKLNVQPQLGHRGKYKSAVYTFTQSEYIEPHREAARAVLNSMFTQMVIDIAEARKLEQSKVESLADSGLISAQRAVDEGLVDGLVYQDQAYEIARQSLGNKASFLYLSPYLKKAGSAFDKGKTIALIYGVGSIRRGESSFSPVSGQQIMGSETIVAAFRAAANNKKVKAILFRINSPGGSYVASDAIWREVKRAGEIKPVIVSMAGVAGSGGYFVAIPAHTIVAQGGTITGSIGVITGKVVTEGLWEKLGVNWDEIHTSENSTIWSPTHPYTQTQWERVQRFLDDVYGDFVRKTAEGRDMPYDSVESVARGRIWSGQDAHKIGLVDEVGGFYEAITISKKAAGIKPDQPVRLRRIPPPRGLLERFIGRESENSRKRYAFAAEYRAVIEKLQPIINVLEQVSGQSSDDILSMPEYEVE